MSMNTPSQPIGATAQAALLGSVSDQATVAPKALRDDPKPCLFTPNATPPGSPAYMPESELYNATGSVAHAFSPAYSPSSPGGTVAVRTCCERRDPPVHLLFLPAWTARGFYGAGAGRCSMADDAYNTIVV